MEWAGQNKCSNVCRYSRFFHAHCSSFRPRRLNRNFTDVWLPINESLRKRHKFVHLICAVKLCNVRNSGSTVILAYECATRRADQCISILSLELSPLLSRALSSHTHTNTFSVFLLNSCARTVSRHKRAQWDRHIEACVHAYVCVCSACVSTPVVVSENFHSFRQSEKLNFSILIIQMCPSVENRSPIHSHTQHTLLVSIRYAISLNCWINYNFENF